MISGRHACNELMMTPTRLSMRRCHRPLHRRTRRQLGGLSVWCVEERGVALYALGRYQESLDSLARLVFQTFRSRLYRAASLVALQRSEEAHKLSEEAVAGNPGLTIARFIHKERYRDLSMTLCANAWKRQGSQHSPRRVFALCRRASVSRATVDFGRRPHIAAIH